MLAEVFSLYHYFLTFSGLEKTLESQKEDSQKKLETLESQMTQVTTDLAKMREKEETEDLGTKLNQLNEELGQSQVKYGCFKKLLPQKENRTFSCSDHCNDPFPNYKLHIQIIII